MLLPDSRLAAELFRKRSKRKISRPSLHHRVSLMLGIEEEGAADQILAQRCTLTVWQKMGRMCGFGGITTTHQQQQHAFRPVAPLSRCMMGSSFLSGARRCVAADGRNATSPARTTPVIRPSAGLYNAPRTKLYLDFCSQVGQHAGIGRRGGGGGGGGFARIFISSTAHMHA